MSFALPYTSGHTYDNVDGICMVPTTTNIPGRRWLHKGTNYHCASGSSMGGGESCATLYISSLNNEGWTGTNGVVLTLYGTNMSADPLSISYGNLKQQQSRLALNCFDITADDWYSLGEFCFSRSASGATGLYPDNFNPLRFDVGDQWNQKPLFGEHCYMALSLDRQKYIWGVWGGHAGISTTYGYVPIQCLKSTKPITDPTWKPSGTGMWINKGAITTATAAAYSRIITAKCSCHNNWYFVGFRDGQTTSDWGIYYSNTSGTTWHSGIRISKVFDGAYSYTNFNFQYDPVSDKTLLFVRPYPDWTGYDNPGYGIFWTDCHRMSGGSLLPSNKGGYFATSVDPQNIDNNTVPTYSGSKIPPWPDESSTIESIFYFNDYEIRISWEGDSPNMSDGDIETYTYTDVDSLEHMLTANTSNGIGTITKVEIRARCYSINAALDTTIHLSPIFSNHPGDDYNELIGDVAGEYTSWFDITNDSAAPSWSLWSDIETLDCKIWPTNVAGKDGTVYCSIVEIRVTYVSTICPLKSFDRYDNTRYPSQLYLEPSTRKIFGISSFLNTPEYSYSYLKLFWKTIGTEDNYVSSSIWTQIGTETVVPTLTGIYPVSSSDNKGYWFVPVAIYDNNKYNHRYFIISGLVWSSQSAWKLMKTCNLTSGSMSAIKWPNISDDRRFVSIAYGYSSNASNGALAGNTMKESYLTFWNNIPFVSEEELQILYSNYPSLRSYPYDSRRYIMTIPYSETNKNEYIPLGDEI